MFLVEAFALGGIGLDRWDGSMGCSVKEDETLTFGKSTIG